MSGCALRRWGGGCSTYKPSDSAAAREMESRLKAMQAERTQQDTMWTAPAAGTPLAAKPNPLEQVYKPASSQKFPGTQ
jgi:hypothetical protein